MIIIICIHAGLKAAKFTGICYDKTYEYGSGIENMQMSGEYVYEEYVISCPRGCGKTYKYKSSVRNHLRECGVEPQFTCRICKRRFTQKGNLKAHLLKIHSDITI